VSGLPLARRLWRIPQSRISSSAENPDAVAVGLLGASNIAKFAVVWPSGKDIAVRVAAVGSRDLQKAKQYAESNGIEKAYGSYQEVLDDPEIEAVYIGLPTEYHHIWTMRSIEAGKHVLVEKPITLNHREATEISNLLESKITNARTPEEAAHYKSLVVLEGYHWRFHPVARHVKRVFQDRKFMGKIRHIRMDFSLVDLKAWSSTLFSSSQGEAGGAGSLKQKIKLLDRWCYAIDTIRFALPFGSKIEVTSAKFSSYRAEANMTATYFEEEGKGKRLGDSKMQKILIKFVVDKAKLEMPSWNLKVSGSLNEIYVTNIGHPYIYHSVHLGSTADAKKRRSVQMYGEGETTFEHQLSAFAAAIRGGQPNGIKGRLVDNKRAASGDDEIWPTLSSSVENMALIDEVLIKGGEKSLSAKHWHNDAPSR